MTGCLRRLVGYRHVRVIDEVDLLGVSPTAKNTFGVQTVIKRQHFEWHRWRPWWQVWRRQKGRR